MICVGPLVGFLLKTLPFESENGDHSSNFGVANGIPMVSQWYPNSSTGGDFRLSWHLSRDMVKPVRG